jgi:hypothetical protein
MMQQHIADANAGITHAEFSAGAQNGIIGFKCMAGEPQQFLTGARKLIFSVFMLLYTIAPLVLIPTARDVQEWEEDRGWFSGVTGLHKILLHVSG